MSPRSFGRRYCEEVGITPMKSVAKLRVEAARVLLAETRMPVKQVAARCGFGSEETLRRSLVRAIAVAPRDYRARFQR